MLLDFEVGRPGYREERLARGEDISVLRGWQLLTPRWRWVLAVALAAGIADGGLLHATLRGWLDPVITALASFADRWR